jgi:glutamate carboxypeptidase
MSIAARETDVLDWLAQQYEPMVELLGKLVDTDSGSYDRAGVARAGEILRAHLEAHGLAVELIEQADGSVSIKATLASARPTTRTFSCSAIGTRCFPRARPPSARSGSRTLGPMARVWPT